MKVYNAKGYRDALAEKRRHRLLAASSFVLILIAAGLIALVYFIFFSSYFKISSIEAKGFTQDHQERILSFMGKEKEKKKFFIPIGQNRFYLTRSSLLASLLEEFPFLEDVSIKKGLEHSIFIEGKERSPLGTWCFGHKCFFFDKSGKLLEEASPSSGYLLMNVQDENHEGEIQKSIDAKFFNPALLTHSGLNRIGVKVQSIVIPKVHGTELHAVTSTVSQVLFSLEFPIQDQIETLEVFLADKNTDQDFSPSRLDLRIAGRVYYK